MTMATRTRPFVLFFGSGESATLSMLRFMKKFMTIPRKSLSCRKLVRSSLFALSALTLVTAGLVGFAEVLPAGEAQAFTLITGLTMNFGDLSPITLWGHIMIILIGLSVAIADQVIRLVAPENQRSDNS